MRKILRLKDVFDRKTGAIPVGHSQFYAIYVLRDENDPFIPGTEIRRLRLVDLGPRARGVVSDDIDRVINALSALPHRPYPAGRTGRQSNEPTRKVGVR